jgi:hypothetical protein
MFTAQAARSRQNMKTVVNISTALKENRAPRSPSRLSKHLNPTGTPARRQLNPFNAAQGQLSLFADSVRFAPISASLRFPRHSAVNPAEPGQSAVIRTIYLFVNIFRPSPIIPRNTRMTQPSIIPNARESKLSAPYFYGGTVFVTPPGLYSSPK